MTRTAGGPGAGDVKPARRSKQKQDGPRGQDCPLVAIGASAGGIPALTRFFGAMPEDPGAAFIVVLHLSPSHESHLAEVLQRSTKLSVVAVGKSTAIRVGCVYVIAPDSVLRIAEGRLSARKPSTDMERRHPVDAIFQSLAEERGRLAICVVLSGSGSNGSAGALKVHEAEGLVLVQEPATAEHDGMPRNVILAGLADRVLPPEAMPELLVGYLRGSLPLLARHEELATQAEPDLEDILAVLRAEGAHDFRPYRRETLVRRVLRRMGLGRIEGFDAYAQNLRGDPEEVRRLVGDLLIHVTGFFRDPEAWKELEEKVVAPLLRSRQDRWPIRVWVPACSTGEEAYSIAMLLLEQAQAAGRDVEIKVFATDAAPQTLARARTGLFSDMVAETLPPERLARFFDKEGDFYRARKVLRDVVVFAQHNVLSDPPFSRLDLVSCRNLLIYLVPEAQDRVVGLLHFALKEGGHLFLGAAEAVDRHGELFEAVSRKASIYARIGPTRHELLGLQAAREGPAAGKGAQAESTLPRGIAAEAREALALAYAPPSALIDERHRILYLHGDLTPFLATPRGAPTLDLVAMVREPLRVRLRALLRLSLKSREPVSTLLELPKAEAGEEASLRLTVSPVPGPRGGHRRLVAFETLAGGAPNRGPEGTVALEAYLDHDQVGELWNAREELRLSVEDYEASTENLKAANEEITSMNEELQSTNEELESSKEELQSLNEELNTVNTQLQGKVVELEDRTNDLNNLLNSTEIGTLFLDQKLCIRWFTAPLRDLFELIQGDVGRPIAHFAPRFSDATFLEDAKQVLRTLQASEKEVTGPDGRWHLRRILPYRTEEDRIEGLVVTFVDITERKSWEEALTAAKAFAERIIDTTHQPLLVLDQAFAVRSANRAFYETFRLTLAEVQGRVLFDLPDWDMPVLRQALAETPAQDAARRDLELDHEFRTLGLRHLRVSARRIDPEALTLLAIEDATESKDAVRREILLSELSHRVKNLLAKVLAIVRLSRSTGGSVRDYSDHLTERIAAIARTEELIVGLPEGIGLRELVEAEAGAVSTLIEPTFEGPDVRLTQREAQSFALALHELSTNAVKYGAFAHPKGALRIVWSVAPGELPGVGAGRILTFRWIESGVPIAGQPTANFGSRLIGKLLPKMLDGTSHWEATPDGVHCTIEMLLSDATAVSEAGSGAAETDAAELDAADS